MSHTLYNGDCFEIMQKIPAKSVDALISDPPYGLTALPWDKKLDWEKFWAESKRICKPGAVIALFSQQPFTTRLINSNREDFRYEIIWHKTSAVGWLDAKRRPLRAHEIIVIFTERFGASTYNPQMTQGFRPYRTTSNRVAVHYGQQKAKVTTSASINGERYPRSVLTFSNRNYPSLHPTQKPLALMEWLVKSYSNIGDLVFDPFMGSGSTGEACVITGRNFVGIERDTEYFRIAKKRLGSASINSQSRSG